MKKPYLIQRCKYKGYEENQTISEAYNPDYMGSSEFEFGALPNSLISMAKEFNTYTIESIDIEGKIVYFLVPSNSIQEYTLHLKTLAREKYGLLKEVIHFSDCFNEKVLKEKEEREKFYQKRYKDKNYKIEWENVWWDVVNHVVWSFNEDAINHWSDALLCSLHKMNSEDNGEIFSKIARDMIKLFKKKNKENNK